MLVGDNGSGKSSILEAQEILHKGSEHEAFLSGSDVVGHGSLRSLLRFGSGELKFEVTLGSLPNETPLKYAFALQITNDRAHVSSVEVSQQVGADPNQWKCVFERPQNQQHHQFLFLHAHTPPTSGAPELPGFRRVAECIKTIEAHVPFRHRAIWQDIELGHASGARASSMLEPTSRLKRYGDNLLSVFYEIQSRSEVARDRLLERVRLGLGGDLQTIRVRPTGDGKVELELGFGPDGTQIVPASELSDGQLSFLALVALVEMSQGASILCFDEPERHLHPALLVRVVTMLEQVGKSTPVLVTTHSDRLLDASSQPAESVVRCVLSDNYTSLSRLITPPQ